MTNVIKNYNKRHYLSYLHRGRGARAAGLVWVRGKGRRVGVSAGEWCRMGVGVRVSGANNPIFEDGIIEN